MSEPSRLFRIAIREEGNYINAYLARPDSMAEAIHVASLRVSVARQYPGVFDQFVNFTKEMVTAMCGSALKAPVDILVEQAPEHERSGRA